MDRPFRKVADARGGGDPHFEIDEVAERATCAALEEWDIPVAYLSEARGLVRLSPKPELLLVIDPIDGSRPAMACFESCCFSVAVTPYSERPTMGDITHALVRELRGGDHFYADEAPGIQTSKPVAAPSAHADLGSMFWSLELTASPVGRLMEVFGHLVDGSVARGGVFVFTSASYSLTRIVTGQLDAHVDISHRILRERPELFAEFAAVGCGKIVTLFPYDIAAAATIARKAGATVTDAYGEPLDPVALVTDKSERSQCSIVCASTAELHRKIMGNLRWQAPSTRTTKNTTEGRP